MAGTLTITSPATDSQTGISTTSVPVSWSFAGTSGATQTQRRVVSTPVGSSTPVYDSGMAASTATSLTVPNFASGVSYNVTVSVIDSAGATTSATRIIVSTYTRPLPAVVTLTPLEQGVQVAITNPSDGARPDVTTNAIYRRLAGSGSDWTLLATVGNGATFVDLTAQANVSYDYFVRSNEAVDSGTVTVTAAAMMGAWVHEAATSDNLQHYPYAAPATESDDIETAFHAFVGRSYPVAEVGVGRSDSLAVSLRITPDIRQATEDVWRDWKRRAPVLYYRDGRGRSWPVNIDGPVQIGPDGHGSILTATLRRVDYPPTTLPASSYGMYGNADGGYGTGGYGTNGYGI